MKLFKNISSKRIIPQYKTEEIVTYINSQWNFSLDIPNDWEVVFENSVENFPWTQPVCLAGPQRKFGRPYMTVVTQIVQDAGVSMPAYMKKAESDLDKAFSNFNLIGAKERRCKGWPSAWMIYSYQGNAVTMKELNVTTFYGEDKVMWFQLICVSVKTDWKEFFPVFSRSILSLAFG